MIPPPKWTPTNSEYHADRSAWSPSMLGKVMKDPFGAYQRYILGMPDQSERGGHFDIGSAIGVSLLEPHLEGTIAYADVVGRNTEKFRKAAEGREICLAIEEAKAYRGAVEAVRNSDTFAANVCRALLNGKGWAEYAHRWTCPETGLALK